jgi:polar amino acid transport system permease protein
MDFVETFLNVPVLRDSLPFLVKGLGMTIQLGVVSLILSFAFGLILALIRIYSPVYLRALVAIYIDFFRPHHCWFCWSWCITRSPISA